MDYGYIVLANSKTNWISQCIKWFTRSQFSHSFVTIPSILDVPLCIEAAEGGIDTTRYDTGYRDNSDEGIEVWDINVSQDIKDEAIESLLNDLEITYGFLQYPWFMWRKLNMLFGRDIKSQNNWSKQGMICSQLCVAYLTYCLTVIKRMDVLEGYGSGSIAPQDLQDIFVAHPDLFTKKISLRLT